MKKLDKFITRIYEFDKHFFNYNEISNDMWIDLIHDAKKFFKVFFDLENNDSTKQQRTIKIPQIQWDFTECKFNCELFSAGGDWEVPIYYFRCKVVDGYAFKGRTKFTKSFFIFIPGKEDGNYHLVRSSDGENWRAPNNNDYKDGIDPERKDRDCWKSLEKFLKELVDLEIKKVKKENEKR